MMNNQLSLSTNFEALYPTGDFPNLDLYPSVWPNIQPLVKEYYYQYPIYLSSIDNSSKLEKSFKLAQVLIDKKLVKSDTIKDFIDLINIIVGIL